MKQGHLPTRSVWASYTHQLWSGLKDGLGASSAPLAQLDSALGTAPGADEREFWERAEQRNSATAKIYDTLGLAEYQAIEAFVRWDGRPLD